MSKVLQPSPPIILNPLQVMTLRQTSITIAIVSVVMLVLEILFAKILLFLHLVDNILRILPVTFLGLAVGGIIVLYFPKPEKIYRAICALPIAILVALSGVLIGAGLHSQILRHTCLILSICIPFIIIGIILAEAFLKYPSNIIYASDLLGGGVGILILFFLLPLLGGEGLLLTTVSLTAGTAFLLRPRFYSFTFILMIIIFCITGWHFTTDKFNLCYIAPSFNPLKRAEFLLGTTHLANPSNHLVSTRWSLISRVDVIDSNSNLYNRFFEENHTVDRESRSINLYYDNSLFSAVTKKHLLLEKQFLCSLVDNPSVLVIGVGGGDDIYRALSIGAKSITGVEINPETIYLMEGKLSEISGNIYKRARIVCMDGRSFVRYKDEKFDLINLFFADLYVPFPNSNVFLENYLYTVEAFVDYFKRLSQDGVLYVGKWINPYNRPLELLRIVATACEALKQSGIQEIEKHIMVVGIDFASSTIYNSDGGYLLLKKTPFTGEDYKKLKPLFSHPYYIIYSPFEIKDNLFAKLITTSNKEEFYNDYGSDVSPTTDDRPFFYEFDKSHSLNKEVFILFIVVASIILFPPIFYFFYRRRYLFTGEICTNILNFSLLGVGYAYLQISFIQKFNIYLGNPIYSFLAVCSSLLIFGSIGAWVSNIIKYSGLPVIILIFTSLIAFYDICLSHILDNMVTSWISIRLSFVFLILLPAGIFIGIPYPKLLQKSKDRMPGTEPLMVLTNSLFLVLGTISSLYISVILGFKALTWIGLTCYLVVAGINLRQNSGIKIGKTAL